MTKKDCREIYFDILKELALWENTDIIYVERNLLEESAKCILFLLKNTKEGI